MNPWLKRACKSCDGGTAPMTLKVIRENLKSLNGWTYTKGALQRTVPFKDYAETVAFVNAVVWIAQRENHHPTLSFGYKQCIVRYSTHAIDGISENDFICAAKIDALLD